MTKKLPKQKSRSTPQTLPTFLDHLNELRNRLFWSVGFIVAASAAAFPVKERIISLLMAPLGSQALYYLTPVGGFSFILKICTYVGVLLAVPVVLYNMYRFVEPLMGGRRHSVAGFVISSTLLAVGGVIFAYSISLPAALHFLTNLNIGHIQAMLTADAYLSFVAAYLLGAAILFQIPLVLLIINSVWPLPPKRLMRAQRYVIIIAFVIAAIISPTPDIANQALLALPIIGMFEVGVVCVWLQNTIAKRRRQNLAVVPQTLVEPVLAASLPVPQRAAPVFHDITPRRRSQKKVSSAKSYVRPANSSLIDSVRAPVRSTGRRGPS